MNLAFSNKPSQKGVALIMVIFIIALGTILVTNLTYSTFLGAQINNRTIQNLHAEFLLKSMVNLARVALLQDKDPSSDSILDNWGIFMTGTPIDASILGISEPGVIVSLEILPEESKIPILQLVTPGNPSTVNIKWRNSLLTLFTNLGFDRDNEVDHTGLMRGSQVTPHEMVANLIDYMDTDNISYNDGSFVGIEDSLSKGRFTNTYLSTISELSRIPGFSPMRLRLASSFLSAANDTAGNRISQININTASNMVLQALHPLIDPSVASQIITTRESAAFTATSQIQPIVGNLVFSDPTSGISPLISTLSNWFQVIAKIDYGINRIYARALLYRTSPSQIPKVIFFETL